LLAFFNSGGSPDALIAQLDAAGMTPGRGAPLVSLDLDGNSWLDLVIALPDPVGPQGSSRPPASLLRPRSQAGSGGSVIVLLCVGNQYAPAAPAIIVETDALPRLHEVAKLTDDSFADLLIGWETCGAHTCFERFEVLSASGEQLLRRALVSSDDLPYPEVSRAADGTVEIIATGIASVGAGPYRKFTRSWEWDPADQGFHLISDRFEPPRYRIHVVFDADAAARAGDLQQAIDLYRRVSLDGSLLDWMDPATEQANLNGYSMFRTVLAYLQRDEAGDARKAYEVLLGQYPAGNVGNAYAGMAQAFWQAYTATDDLEVGCQAARDYAEAHADDVITPLYFGYANPVYTSADFCPVHAL